MLRQGDTDLIPLGGGHGSSRATYMGGTAIWRASDEIIEKGTALAADIARGGRGRHPLRGRPVRRLRHRPRRRHARGRGARAREGQAARHLPLLDARVPDLPQRHACRRGRDRPRDRPRDARALHRASTITACWSIRWSSPARRMARWRRAAARRCSSTRPTIPNSGQMVAGIVHGLRHAARRRPAVVRPRLQRHALHHQSARREGLRRGRRDRGLPGDRQRHPRCAGAARRHQFRRPGDRRRASGRRSQTAR